ncbi:MAG: type IV pilus twitching motility protein PilT [Pyrinomonadaceae bacterium]|nr:type IV pilus twitching motility protein PilT [Pyrinomonadaceae bacterium]
MTSEKQRSEIFDLLSKLLELDGSDLHLRFGSPPQVRIHGQLKPLESYPALTKERAKALAYSVLTEKQIRLFEEKLELDFSLELEGKSRFRVNVFMQKGTVGTALRAIPYEIKGFDELGLPPVVSELCRKPRGLVLVTGPTGSGKSTTLASMIDQINRTRHEHILTIEDPIEFLHNHKQCVVTQRELGLDTYSFGDALRASLREDPDIVLIGEMRDVETIEMALRVAETGHLTFATLHTNTAPSTINRVIDVFPAIQQSQIRTQLSLVLEGIMCQALLPNATGDGRVMSMEVLIPNSAVRNLIRDDKIHQIYSMMQAGADRYGMQTLNQSLAALFKKRRITLETAMSISPNIDELKDLCHRQSRDFSDSLGRVGGGTPADRRAPVKFETGAASSGDESG